MNYRILRNLSGTDHNHKQILFVETMEFLVEIPWNILMLILLTIGLFPNTPPQSTFSLFLNSMNAHHRSSQSNKPNTRQWFGKDVSQVVFGGDWL